jgi:hypothetical protein
MILLNGYLLHAPFHVGSRVGLEFNRLWAGLMYSLFSEIFTSDNWIKK